MIFRKKYWALLFTICSNYLLLAQTNLPPEISVSGRQVYCPLEQILIAENFTITDPDDIGINEFSVQISSGYVINEDTLLLTGNHPTINATWNNTEGKLTLTPIGTAEILYTDLIPAVQDIVYASVNPNVSGERFFSFNIGDANYLPSTDHYYEYVPDDGIDWESARQAAANRTYFGLQGYLATILTADEAQLSGKQAAGAGWIGGSDAAQEGEWRWVTGPEAGTVFWNGGINGTTPNFAFWNSNEPNNLGDEDYAHVTDPSIGTPGSWNDLPLIGGTGLYVPRGYIVEYGGMPGDPVLNISGSTSIYISEITSTTGGESCSSGSITLTASVNEGDIFWYDAPTGGNLVGTGNTFTTPLLTITTVYYAFAGPVNCSTASRAPVTAVINPSPDVTDPVLLEACNTSEDAFAQFNLTLANSSISNNFEDEIFQYYPTEADAQNDTNRIFDPANYTNVTETNDTVWVRVIANSGCFEIARINIEVTSIVIPDTFQLTYEACDDYLDSNGNDSVDNDDTDGIASFNFSDARNRITTLYPISQQPNISVAFYESATDANNQVNEIINTDDYRNINSPNTQLIYARVESSNDGNCSYLGTHITLNVIPVPDFNIIPDLNVCDDDSDGDDSNGFVQNIDLESQTSIILGSQNPADFTVTYHASEDDANNAVNSLTSPFTNSVQSTQTIYVRVLNNITGCSMSRNSFVVNVGALPTINMVVELRQCDTDTDGFSPFNLLEAGFDISANFMNETFEFFETLADAQNGVNQILNPTAYTNQVQTSDTVWARAISNFGCYRIAEVNLTVSTTGIPASFQRSFNACDDFLDINGNDTVNNDDTDGVSRFDFSSVESEVRALFPLNQQLAINFYRTEADALAENNPIADPSNYRNIGFPNTQDIYVRVDSELDNDCLGLGHHITLTVDPVPVINPVIDLVECDNADDGDFNNGIIQTFNLESQTANILGGQDPLLYTVTYHISEADASTGVNAIVNTSMYTNITPNRQPIYVRISNNSIGCFTYENAFDLIVNPLPTANFVEDLQVCDDGMDGSTQNGITQNIDLELQTAGILGTQDPTQYTVTYHASLTDAQSGASPIVNPFENTVAFSQLIYVRITNTTTSCVNSISNFNVIVNPEPTVVDFENLPYCDDDSDGDDTNGFVQNIDLDSQIPLILGPDQDEDDFTVTFHETQTDAEQGINALTTPYENTIADLQPIFVSVANNDTGCVNDNFSFNIIINPLPDFTVTSPQIVCLNGPPLTLSIENPAGIYDYVWTDPSENTIIGSQITVTSGGLYTVTGTATDGTGCSRIREIQVNESIIATLTADDISIVDDSDNNTITIDPTNLGIGNYEYALYDENDDVVRDYQDDPKFENLPGGFYTILVRDKNGCGVATLDTSVVEFPDFFTPNNDGVNDTWAVKGVNSTFFPTSEVNIFNRFGKLVAQINIDNRGWDGTFQGKVLPSDDYWYAIKLVDREGNAREKRGNLSLLRR